MVLGRDVMMDGVVDFTEKALVDRFEYVSLARADVIRWVMERWKPILGYIPRYITLIKGWVCFYIQFGKYAKLILDRTWVIGKGLLVLQH